MKPEEIAWRRLAGQFLTVPGPAKPADVVRRLGAVQAQDYAGAKWALALRTKKAVTDAAVERAVDAGAIVRTHVLRPTWHFVAACDLRWMLALTGPRISRALASYNRVLEITPAVIRRSHAAITKALEGGRHLTRAEVAAVLSRAKVGALTGHRFGRLVVQAELDAIVCSGARRGKHSTYALLDERVTAAGGIERDAALGRAGAAVLPHPRPRLRPRLRVVVGPHRGRRAARDRDPRPRAGADRRRRAALLDERGRYGAAQEAVCPPAPQLRRVLHRPRGPQRHRPAARQRGAGDGRQRAHQSHRDRERPDRRWLEAPAAGPRVTLRFDLLTRLSRAERALLDREIERYRAFAGEPVEVTGCARDARASGGRRVLVEGARHQARDHRRDQLVERPQRHQRRAVEAERDLLEEEDGEHDRPQGEPGADRGPGPGP